MWSRQHLKILGPALKMIECAKCGYKTRAKKRAVLRITASATRFCKPDISSASEQAFLFIWGHICGCSTPTKRGVCFPWIDSLLVNWCRHSPAPCGALRSDVFVKTKCSVCLVTVELTPHTYAHLRETLCFCLFALHCHDYTDGRLRCCHSQ